MLAVQYLSQMSEVESNMYLQTQVDLEWKYGERKTVTQIERQQLGGKWMGEMLEKRDLIPKEGRPGFSPGA